MAIGSTLIDPRLEPALAEVSAAVATADLLRAGNLAERALRQGMAHPTFFNARGLAFQAAGRYGEALEDFRRASAYLPRDATIHNAIGVCLTGLERFGAALKAFDEAIECDPYRAQSHFRRGAALSRLGNHEDAIAAYERALQLDPHHADAMANLSLLLARGGSESRALELAERALSLKPGDTNALFALATLDADRKRHAAVEARIRPLLDSPELSAHARVGAYGLLGDALDGQSRYAEAFEIYNKRNEELRRLHGAQFVSAESRAPDATGHMITYFEKTPAAQWKARPAKAPEPGRDSPKEHVFLLGFLRSGTTLLEQVLGSSPEIVALEEKGTLNMLGSIYMTSEDGLDLLSSLDGQRLEDARKMYWARVRELNVDIAGKIFLDKQPLNTIKLPLIAKLFPDAKVLFALRDPRDVVFSCFRRQFRVNVTTYEFLSLTDAAKFYADTMRLAELYREKLSLNLYEHRYEDMVQDFEGRVRAVCDFIGTEWSDTMREFDKHGPAIDLRSPSATQVRQPLYGEGQGQWRRYAEQLAPVMPILKPWVERFGYPPA